MIPPRELMAKLEIKSGDRLWLINAPAELAEELAAGAEVEMVHEKDEYDGVIAFIDSAAEEELLVPRILSELPPDGLLWIGGSTPPQLADAGWEGGETVEIGDGRQLRRYQRG